MTVLTYWALTANIAHHHDTRITKMKVKQLIKELKKMPQNEEVGLRAHDYDAGDSDSVFCVTHWNDEEATNYSNKIQHRVTIDA